jgi:hypothetical protein
MDMTTLEATGHLFEWFSQNDSFQMEKDFIKVIPITETPERDKVAFLTALESLQENLLLKSAEYEGSKYWVLSKAYNSYEQTINLSPATAHGIAKIVNSFCDITGLEGEKCNPSELQEKDVSNLIFICTKFIQKEGEE